LEELKTKTDKTSRPIAIVLEIVLVIVFMFFYILYSQGNHYVVGNTIDGLPILIAAMVVGLLSGFLFVYIIGKTRLNNIKYVKFQEFIGFWALFAPIFLFGFIGYSLNLRLSEEKSESFKTVIEDKTGDLIMQTYYLETGIKNKRKKVRVSKSEWKQNNIGDTIKLSIIKGGFGYDVIRYESETTK